LLVSRSSSRLARAKDMVPSQSRVLSSQGGPTDGSSGRTDARVAQQAGAGMAWSDDGTAAERQGRGGGLSRGGGPAVGGVVGGGGGLRRRRALQRSRHLRCEHKRATPCPLRVQAAVRVKGGRGSCEKGSKLVPDELSGIRLKATKSAMHVGATTQTQP
jgi:hypothetical protein